MPKGNGAAEETLSVEEAFALVFGQIATLQQRFDNLVESLGDTGKAFSVLETIDDGSPPLAGSNLLPRLAELIREDYAENTGLAVGAVKLEARLKALEERVNQ